MNILGKDGVLVLSSVTGGDRSIEVPADKINLGFVLGNKVVVGTVNANREHFEQGVKDLAQCEFQWPGWLSKFLTHRVEGLDNYDLVTKYLHESEGVVKIVVDITKP
jgi:threonine dehydrogenase-like Zn-dependent dehydrogenase